MEAKKHPYEFLARWDAEGKLSGAHVGFRYVVTDGDERTETLQPVMPVDIGSGKGFPLKDILDQLHVDALTRCDALEAEVKAKEEAGAQALKDAQEQHAEAMQALHAEAVSEIAKRDEQIEALRQEKVLAET